jgi:GNAT superfamily N-acetyltransferase
LDDVGQSFTLLQGYAQEGWQAKKCPPDDETIMTSLCDVFNAVNFVKAVVEHEGKIVGLAFGYVGKTWWKRPCGSIDMFYTSPEMRGKGISRLLLAECLRQFTEFSCGFVYAGAESGLGEKNDKLYANLFKRFGFDFIGGGRLILYMGD